MLKQLSKNLRDAAQQIDTLREDRSGGFLSIDEAAEIELRHRRIREEIFGAGFSTDACWDILLDLFVAERRKREISVSSACIASRVPATTALRYIRALEAAGHLMRTNDHLDGRRIIVRLTPSTRDKVTLCLQRCWASATAPLRYLQ